MISVFGNQKIPAINFWVLIHDIQKTDWPQSFLIKITPFSGHYKDWLRFWNQFTVEVDGAAISEISKFNYLLELVKAMQKKTSSDCRTQRMYTAKRSGF